MAGKRTLAATSLARAVGKVALKIERLVADMRDYANNPANVAFQRLGTDTQERMLAPLVRDEILIRVLRSPIGERVAQVGKADSTVRRIAKAVSRLRTDFDQPVVIEELATLVNMSVTSFHRQFKAVTGMSPLQYQKTLRLQEARRLMLTAMLDAGTAGRRVGYSSPAQFSREYGRFFGSAPTKDINRLREGGLASGDSA